MDQITAIHDALVQAGVTFTRLVLEPSQPNPVEVVVNRADGLVVEVDGVPTNQRPLATTTVMNVDLTPAALNRMPRPLTAIRNDIQALSSTQWTKIWNDLFAPDAISPRKYLSDYGTNAGPIFVFDWALFVSGPTAAQQKAGQISLAAMYTQDNPKYLVNPPFDTTINIPGDQPA